MGAFMLPILPLPGMASLASAVLGRFAVFAVLWWLLTEGRADGLAFGLCCSAVAALLPLIMVPMFRFSAIQHWEPITTVL